MAVRQISSAGGEKQLENSWYLSVTGAANRQDKTCNILHSGSV
jgi:hypothetical protein